MKKILKLVYFFVLFFVSAFIAHFHWFSCGEILQFGDWGYRFLDYSKNLYLEWGSWNGSFQLGSININLFSYPSRGIIFSLISFFGFQYQDAARFGLFIPLAILSFLSPYFYAYHKTKNIYISSSLAFFYSSIPYFLITQTNHHPISFVFSITPLLFLSFEKAVLKNKFKYWVYFILILFIAIGYEIRITFISSVLLLLYMPFLLKQYKHKINISKYISFLIILIFTQLYWFLTIISTGINKHLDVANRGLFGNNLFDLLHAFTITKWNWTGGAVDWTFTLMPVPIYLFILPIIIFWGYFFILNKKKKWIYFYFIFLCLIGIFLTKQSAMPFNEIYEWLYKNIPTFNLYREASKLFLITSIGYLGVLIFLMKELYKFKRFFLLFFLNFLIITISFVNFFPLISQKIDTTFVPRKIPNDYLEFNNLVGHDFFRTLWIPRSSSWTLNTYFNPKIDFITILDNELNFFLHNYYKINSNVHASNIKNILGLFYLNDIFDIASVKYIGVPICDIDNNDNFFLSYGSGDCYEIRNWYISELDKIEWLKKIDIGTKELVVYENENYKPYIRSVNGLYQFEDFNNLEGKYQFINNYLNNEFDFVIKDEIKNSNNLTCLYGLFDEVNYKKINQEKLLISDGISIKQNKINNFYNSQTVREIFYRKHNNEIFVYTKSTGDLFSGNQNINVFKAQEKILARQIIDLNKRYYFKINNQIIKADNYTGLIGKIEQNNVLEIYSLDTNLIDNHSFENGTWTEKVGDCNNYDDNRILAMSLNANVKSDGEQSLQLEATRHIACTNQRFKIEPGEYVLSFDYQSNNTDKAGFYLSLNDGNKTIFKDILVIDNNEWQTHNQLITVPEGASLARLHIYAYESDKIKNNIVRYDNFSFAKLNLEKAITISQPKNDYKKIEIDLNQEENIFEYKEAGYDYKNQILNGSFENGFWNEKVGDCHSYDDNPILAIDLNKDLKSDGEQSLQLEATRHIACTSLGQSIKSGSNYLFSFDYQSDNAKQMGYYLGFNDSEKTKISEKIDIENSEWKTIEKNIKVPEGATKMSIYVYAYESDGKTNNIVRYDNFKLIELPDLTDRFYLVSEPKEKLNEPKETNFDLINPTKKLIHIKGATTPFFLAMSESYHAQWELQMNNERIQGILNSWWPFAKRQKVNDEYHYKLANFLNAWYIDVPELCKNSNKACTKNEDGSYDIEMVAEFWPQRWFYLGLLISGTTLIGCVGYLGYDFIRERKKRKKEKVK